MFIFKTQKNQTVLIDRPDITLQRGIHPKENLVCIAFPCNLQQTDVLKGQTTGRWSQSVGNRYISENNEDENHSGERKNQSDVSEKNSGVSRMNYFGKKLYFHTRFGSGNRGANSEINAIIYFHVRWR